MKTTKKSKYSGRCGYSSEEVSGYSNRFVRYEGTIRVYLAEYDWFTLNFRAQANESSPLCTYALRIEGLDLLDYNSPALFRFLEVVTTRAKAKPVQMPSLTTDGKACMDTSQLHSFLAALEHLGFQVKPCSDRSKATDYAMDRESRIPSLIADLSENLSA